MCHTDAHTDTHTHTCIHLFIYCIKFPLPRIACTCFDAHAHTYSYIHTHTHAHAYRRASEERSLGTKCHRRRPGCERPSITQWPAVGYRKGYRRRGREVEGQRVEACLDGGGGGVERSNGPRGL